MAMSTSVRSSSSISYSQNPQLRLTGANPSAEEQDEALEAGAEQVNNVVYSFRLASTSFDKKTYLGYLKVNSYPPGHLSQLTIHR